jgi:predicted DNA-binding transcriptional regulator AlpA
MDTCDDSQIWLTAPQVARRFGITAMTLWRWMHDPELDFPTPVQRRKRNYFDAGAIAEWERRTAVGVASKCTRARKAEATA